MKEKQDEIEILNLSDLTCEQKAALKKAADERGLTPNEFLEIYSKAALQDIATKKPPSTNRIVNLEILKRY